MCDNIGVEVINGKEAIDIISRRDFYVFKH